MQAFKVVQAGEGGPGFFPDEGFCLLSCASLAVDLTCGYSYAYPASDSLNFGGLAFSRLKIIPASSPTPSLPSSLDRLLPQLLFVFALHCKGWRCFLLSRSISSYHLETRSHPGKSLFLSLRTGTPFPANLTQILSLWHTATLLTDRNQKVTHPTLHSLILGGLVFGYSV